MYSQKSKFKVPSQKKGNISSQGASQQNTQSRVLGLPRRRNNKENSGVTVGNKNNSVVKVEPIIEITNCKEIKGLNRNIKLPDSWFNVNNGSQTKRETVTDDFALLASQDFKDIDKPFERFDELMGGSQSTRSHQSQSQNKQSVLSLASASQLSQAPKQNQSQKDKKTYMKQESLNASQEDIFFGSLRTDDVIDNFIESQEKEHRHVDSKEWSMSEIIGLTKNQWTELDARHSNERSKQDNAYETTTMAGSHCSNRQAASRASNREMVVRSLMGLEVKPSPFEVATIPDFSAADSDQTMLPSVELKRTHSQSSVSTIEPTTHSKSLRCEQDSNPPPTEHVTAERSAPTPKNVSVHHHQKHQQRTGIRHDIDCSNTIVNGTLEIEEPTTTPVSEIRTPQENERSHPLSSSGGIIDQFREMRQSTKSHSGRTDDHARITGDPVKVESTDSKSVDPNVLRVINSYHRDPMSSTANECDVKSTARKRVVNRSNLSVESPPFALVTVEENMDPDMFNTDMSVSSMQQQQHPHQYLSAPPVDHHQPDAVAINVYMPLASVVTAAMSSNPDHCHVPTDVGLVTGRMHQAPEHQTETNTLCTTLVTDEGDQEKSPGPSDADNGTSPSCLSYSEDPVSHSPSLHPATCGNVQEAPSATQPIVETTDPRVMLNPRKTVPVGRSSASNPYDGYHVGGKKIRADYQSYEQSQQRTGLTSGSLLSQTRAPEAYSKDFPLSGLETYTDITLENPLGKSRRLVALERLAHYSAPNTWVQCERCQKWRNLGRREDVIEFSARQWVCSNNEDADHNSCSSPEDVEEEHSNSVVYGKYSRGSLVLARFNRGINYYPAMIDEDPDYQLYFWPAHRETQPRKYHVVFLEQPVSRAWIEDQDIKPFDERYTISPYRSQDYAKWQKSHAVAVELSTKTIKERLNKWSFVKRYRGKWGKIGDLLFEIAPTDGSKRPRISTEESSSKATGKATPKGSRPRGRPPKCRMVDNNG